MNIKKQLALTFAFILAVGNMSAVTAYADFEETDSGYVYVKEDGSNATGWLKVNGKKYYFDSDGIMKTGWLKFKSGKTYYFKSNGQMVTGKVKINGKVYDFGEDGNLTTAETTNKKSSSKKDELKAEKEKLLAENEKYQEKIDELTPDLEEKEYYMNYYKELYEECKSSYDDAVYDAKKNSKTRVVLGSNGWSTKQDDYQNDYYVKEWKKLLDKSEKNYRSAQKEYNTVNSKVSSYKKAIRKNKERIKEINTALKST